MASSVPRNSGGLLCSKYTKFLLHVSQNLTKENLSTIKMIICSEKLLRPDVVEEIQFGGDLIRSLLNARLVTDSSVKVLRQMLRDVGRVDLAGLASDYEELHNNNNDVIRTGRPEAQQHKEDPSDYTRSDVKVDCACLPEETELPMSMEEPCSQSSSQESCVSMTDEEKLEELENKKGMGIIIEEYDSQDLFD